MTPVDVLSRTVFTIDGEAVDWAAVIEAAKAWGEWDALEQAVSPDTADRRSTRRPCAGPWRSAPPRCGTTAACSRPTRPRQWFARWGVTVADWLSHLRRQVVGEVAPDPESAVWIEAITSGTLERSAWRLARSLTAHRALGGAGWPTVEALDQAMSDFAAREAASPDRRAAVIAEHAVAWTLFDLQHVQLADEATARELCERPIEEVAAKAGVAVVDTRTTLEDLPDQLRAHLQGAAAGDVVGPVPVDGAWRIIVVDARTLPTDDDPQIADRARKRLAAEALHREMARRVHWLEHVPPRSTEPVPDDASAEEEFSRPARRIRHFPTVWAVDEADCGAACLAMACRYYGRRVDLAHVRTVAGTGVDGTSLHGLVVGAEQLGLAARARKASQELDALPLPAVCHWEGNHWVVLYDVDERHVRVADPASGLRRIARPEFEAKWSGYCALVARTPALDDLPEARPAWRWLGPFARPHRRTLLIAVGLASWPPRCRC